MGANAGASEDEQAVLGQDLAQLVHDRQDRFSTAIHDGAPADLDNLQPRKDPDRAYARDGTGKIAILEGLACERRGDVLDGIGSISHGGGT